MTIAHVHIRDEDWLKTAALYWPSVRRLVPFGYAKNDSPTAQTFFDAQILRDEDPRGLLDPGTWDLVRALRENAGALVRDYSLKRAFADWDGRPWGEGSGPDREIPALGWIHVTKFPQKAVDYLSDIGIAQYGRTVGSMRTHSGRPEEWIGLHPVLAGAYMTALAGRLSEQGHFQPLTDQVDLRVATPNSDIGAALKLLLGRAATEPKLSTSACSAVDTYVMLAMQYARPANLESIPADKIVDSRARLAEELDAFRDYVASQQDDIIELATIPVAHRRLEAFAEHVQRTVELPLRRLERGLQLHKLEPTRSLLLAGSFTAPATVSATVGAIGATRPAAATAVGAAVAVGNAWWQIGNIRAHSKASSPVGYLLDVRDHLTPKTVAARARKVLRGRYGRAERTVQSK